MFRRSGRVYQLGIHLPMKECTFQQPGEGVCMKYREYPHLFADEDFVVSSATQPGGIINCVAVAHKDGITAVRSTRDVDKNTLYFDKGEWDAFLVGVNNGEFAF